MVIHLLIEIFYSEHKWLAWLASLGPVWLGSVRGSERARARGRRACRPLGAGRTGRWARRPGSSSQTVVLTTGEEADREEKDKGVIVISFLLPIIRSCFAKQFIKMALASPVELLVELKPKKLPSQVKWSPTKRVLVYMQFLCSKPASIPKKNVPNLSLHIQFLSPISPLCFFWATFLLSAVKRWAPGPGTMRTGSSAQERSKYDAHWAEAHGLRKSHGDLVGR